ncbi:MAG: ATP-binding protein [Verrucomicrobiales bacterium]|nr:ATP-binding protein [Verrucomicrobiales bacterium]
MSSRPMPTDLESCEMEVISRPEFIQPHGVLLVLREKTFVIERISLNAKEYFGLEPEELIGRKVTEFVSAANQASLEDLLSSEVVTYPNPLNISVASGAETCDYDGIAHRADGHIILELENRRSVSFRSNAASRGIEHHFGLTSRTLDLIRNLPSIAEAGAAVCRELKDFTGFDRVMLYLFAPDNHGEVIAEAKEPELEPFLGLHFPAGDIPKNARDLYIKNLIRLIADVNANPVGLYPAQGDLDMSMSALRAVSPFHIKYLQNMGVASSMSISLVEGDRLWGLLACHHYQGPMLVPCSTRVSCVHYGIVIASQLQVMMRSYFSRDLSLRKEEISREVKILSRSADLHSTIETRAPELIRLCNADGMAFLDDDTIFTDGSTPSKATIVELWKRCPRGPDTKVYACESIDETFSDIDMDCSPVAGFLVIHCSHDWQLMFFRKEYLHEIRWGGDPGDPQAEKKVLTPRHSFAEWVESVKGHCHPWTEIDLLVAEELRSVFMVFVMHQAVVLQKLYDELREKNVEIQQFAYSVSHDLKSPLVTINGWIAALDDELAAGNYDEAREAFERIRAAATRMGRLIEDLLAFSKIGRMKGEIDLIDMDELCQDIHEEFQILLGEKGITLEIDGNLPSFHGYETEVRRAMENLISNAIKYGCTNDQPRIGISGKKLENAYRFSVRDNGEGIEPEYQSRIFELFQRLDTSHSGTGVGLASVAKVAQFHRGKCGVNSAAGQGAEFWIEFGELGEN